MRGRAGSELALGTDFSATEGVRYLGKNATD